MKDLLHQVTTGQLNAELFNTVNKTGLAELTYNRLIEHIGDFEKELNKEQEVGASLVPFGNNYIFHITGLGYHGQEMIIFYGLDDKGQKVKLMQHVTQLNVLLVAVKKIGDEPNRIGII